MRTLTAPAKQMKQQSKRKVIESKMTLILNSNVKSQYSVSKNIMHCVSIANHMKKPLATSRASALQPQPSRYVKVHSAHSRTALALSERAGGCKHWPRLPSPMVAMGVWEGDQMKKPRLTIGGIAISCGTPPNCATNDSIQPTKGMTITVAKQNAQMLYVSPQGVCATSPDVTMVSTAQITYAMNSVTRQHMQHTASRKEEVSTTALKTKSRTLVTCPHLHSIWPMLLLRIASPAHSSTQSSAVRTSTRRWVRGPQLEK